jgi:hypothetical protein
MQYLIVAECPLDNGAVHYRAMSKTAGVAIAYSSPQNVMLLLNGELFCDSALQPSGEHTRMLNRMRG